MAVGASIKKGFSITVQSVNLVLALFVFGLAWNLINLFYTAKFQNTAEPQLSAPIIAIGIFFILISIFVQAGSLGYVRDLIKNGSADFGAFLSAGRKYYLKLLLLGLVVALVVGVFVLVAALAIAATGQKVNPVSVTISVVVGLAGVYAVLLLFLAPYAAVADDQKVLQSLKTSVSLVQKNLLPAIGLALVLVVIGFAFGLVLGAIYALLTTAVKGIASQVVFAVLSSLVNAFLGLVVTGAFMNFYFSLSHNNTGGAA